MKTMPQEMKEEKVEERKAMGMGGRQRGCLKGVSMLGYMWQWFEVA